MGRSSFYKHHTSLDLRGNTPEAPYEAINIDVSENLAQTTTIPDEGEYILWSTVRCKIRVRPDVSGLTYETQGVIVHGEEGNEEIFGKIYLDGESHVGAICDTGESGVLTLHRVG